MPVPRAFMRGSWIRCCRVWLKVASAPVQILTASAAFLPFEKQLCRRHTTSCRQSSDKNVGRRCNLTSCYIIHVQCTAR